MTIQEKLGIVYALYNCDVCRNCVAIDFCMQDKEAKLNFILEVQKDVADILKAKEEGE